MICRLMVLTAVIFLAADAASAYEHELGEHQWRHRLLFLVAPDGDDPDLAAKKRNIELSPYPMRINLTLGFFI